MAWRFRLGSRRGESEGTGVQVAEDLREEAASQNVATEDSAASTSAPESMTAESLDLAAISEIRESSDRLADSRRECLAIARDLTAFCTPLGMPFGFNVESVSIRRAEIEATTELARDVAALVR